MSRVIDLETALVAWLTDPSRPAWAATFGPRAGDWLQFDFTRLPSGQTAVLLQSEDPLLVARAGALELWRQRVSLFIASRAPGADAVRRSALETLTEQLQDRLPGVVLGSAVLLSANRGDLVGREELQQAQVWITRIEILAEVES